MFLPDQTPSRREFLIFLSSRWGAHFVVVATMMCMRGRAGVRRPRRFECRRRGSCHEFGALDGEAIVGNWRKSGDDSSRLAFHQLNPLFELSRPGRVMGLTMLWAAAVKLRLRRVRVSLVHDGVSV